MLTVINIFLEHKNRFWLFVALPVAFFFRVYLLNAQSLWNDEGTSIALAARSVEAIINGAAQDIHPPLYYFQLHYWLLVSGNSEFAVRFLSVIAGVLIVALTYRIARFFFDVEVANVAAYFAAFSPFGIYYSQETRMYIWVALWVGLSVLAMLWMLEVRDWKPEGERQKLKAKSEKPEIGNAAPIVATNSRRKRTLAWALYILATIAALYTHYFGAAVLVFENVSFAVWVWLMWRSSSVIGRRSSVGHSIIFWLIAQIICILAFLPWYFLTREQLAAWPAISEPFDLPTLLWRALNVFSVGFTLDPAASTTAAVAFAVLLFFGARLSARNPQTIWGVTLMMAWALVPVLAMYAVSISRPAYNPKFLLLATPPFFILAARGLSHIHPGIFLRPRNPMPRSYLLRYFYFAIALVAAVSFIPSLQNYYYNPQSARDDYRAILRLIDSNARVGDGILVDAPGQIDVVRYYHRGDQQLFLLPRMRPPDPSATRADVDAMLAKAKRVFAIYYATPQSDPQNIIETRLAERAFKARDEWYGNVRLALYGVAPRAREAGQSAAVRFGDEITLERWQLDARDARVGDVLTLTLNWVAISQPAARYKVFAHLLDSSGRVIAQRDGEPVADTRFTTTWRAGEAIADHYGLLVETPGDFAVEVGMYRADNGARLPIVAPDGKTLGDHLVLGTVSIR